LGAASIRRILMRAGIAERLGHRPHDAVRRGRVGVADSERDHVDSGGLLLLDLLLELGKQVGRYPAEPLGRAHAASSRLAMNSSENSPAKTGSAQPVSVTSSSSPTSTPSSPPSSFTVTGERVPRNTAATADAAAAAPDDNRAP